MKPFQLLLSLLFCLAATKSLGAPGAHFADDVEVTVLSTNLANDGTRGEWGFSALIESNGDCILWDTGRYPETVLLNAQALGKDLSCVTTIVLSHFHFDHTGGLERILKRLQTEGGNKTFPIYVAKGFFLPRYLDPTHPAYDQLKRQFNDDQWNGVLARRTQLEALGADFRVVSKAKAIAPGIWATGPIARVHDEKNFPSFSLLRREQHSTMDTVPDSQGLVIRTSRGPIVLSGCGHSGAVNLVQQVSEQIQEGPLLALMGGLHLFNASEETLAWTGEALKAIGIQNLMAGHCTGVVPMFSLKEDLDLTRQSAVIGAVGARFSLQDGISATAIAH